MSDIDTTKIDLTKIIKDFIDFQKWLEEQQKQEPKEIKRDKKSRGGSIGSIGSMMDVPLYTNPYTIRRAIESVRQSFADGGAPTDNDQLIGQLQFLIGALQGSSYLNQKDLDLLLQLREELKLLQDKK